MDAAGKAGVERAGRAMPPRLWLFEYTAWEGLEPRAGALLSAEEEARARRYVTPAQRRRYRLSRALLRALLARCLGRAPRSLPIVTTAQGKPCLADGALHFNLSHSGRILAIAVGDAAVGVDVEGGYPGLDADGLARRILSPAELNTYAALSPAGRRSYLLRRWSEQEAFAKATGMGLALDPRSCRWERADARSFRVYRRDTEEGPWHTHYLGRFRGCHVSLCSAVPDWPLIYIAACDGGPSCT